ncbi:MAG: universal stress protein [Chloroflexi bacterium]|nr:universal stress protein [Chloroflexota bacterium]
MLDDQQSPSVKKVLVGTDRSETADRAVRWAARMAAGYGAELLVVQVIVPAGPDASADRQVEAQQAAALERLREFAAEVAGSKGHARVSVGNDPADALLRVIEEEAIDVVVVGNLGMAGRKQFLLGNLPNRISHNARCTVIIVNTAGPGAAATVGGRGKETSRGGPGTPGWEGRLLRRGLHIARVLAQAGLRDAWRQSQPGDEAAIREGARRFRAALDELGPTFAKIGQILSTRRDLLPPAFIEELTKLQERVTPLTEAEVVAVMEQELRVPWEDVFASIEPQPLAAGTIAQVHRATLETGERVVVKVQRPTAERDIMLDLGLLELLARKVAQRPTFSRVVDMPAIIRHLSDSLRRELDFRQEARNIHRMRAVLAHFPRLAVPKVFDEYSTARLLTMEEVQGIPLRDAPAGSARTEAARQLLESFYHQVFAEGFFHADPHPGNMKWWNDKIYFLDLGMVGELEPEVRQLLLLLLLSFSQKDVRFLSEVVLSLAGNQDGGEESDANALRADLERFIERFKSLSLKEIQLGPMLQEMTQISIRHNVRLPASLALAGKAFAQMQLAATELEPSLDPFAVASSFVVKSTLRQLAGSLDPGKLFYEVQKARARFMRLLEAIEGVTGARPGTRLQVNFRGTEPLERTISQAIGRLSLALVVSGALVGTALTAASNKVPWEVPAGIAGGGLLVSLWLLVDIARRGR